MRQVLLDRTETGAEGTFGWLRVVDPLTGEVLFSCATVELPWNDNVPFRSCIPPGPYVFKWRTDSPKHGECYEAVAVPGRENIQIHAANLAGDIRMGYVAQLDGCIAPGSAVVEFPANKKPAGPRAQRGVSSSTATTKELVLRLNKEPFVLTITGPAEAS